jgi:phytoene synthase
MSPAEYCRQRAAASGSSFYYSFLFLPEQERYAITALYAFCREVDDVVDECSDIGVARLKLDWWRQEIDRVFDAAPQHPVGQALYAAVRTYGLPHEGFAEIIDGMEMDLDRFSYPDFKALSLYCHRVAGTVGCLSAEIFGYEDRATLKYAHALGVALQLTNILRDVREDATRGRIYLPRDEMQRFGVSPDEIQLGISSGRAREFLQYQAERIRMYYQQALESLPEVDRYRQRSGLIMAEIYLTLLREIEEDGYRVLEHRIVLTPIRKLWIAWKTYRRERRLLQDRQRH